MHSNAMAIKSIQLNNNHSNSNPSSLAMVASSSKKIPLTGSASQTGTLGNAVSTSTSNSSPVSVLRNIQEKRKKMASWGGRSHKAMIAAKYVVELYISPKINNIIRY